MYTKHSNSSSFYAKLKYEVYFLKIVWRLLKNHFFPFVRTKLRSSN